MSKKNILLCACIILFLPLFSQDLEAKKMRFQGYSGGMMLHTGYLLGGSVDVPNYTEKTKIQGFTFGIGGALRFHFGKHLRIGSEGYNSTLRYGKNKSSMSLGWGGLLIDCQWEIAKFTLFCGGTIGGGSMKNTILTEPVSANSAGQKALYQKYSIMVIDPFIGMEYAISSKIHLIIKADCIVNLTQKQSDFPIGTRVYAGIVFFHATKRSAYSTDK